MDYKASPVKGVNENGQATYCSPLCGFGCLQEHYDRAHREADALVQQLGSDWEKRVWENWKMWHYEVKKGPWEVHTYRDQDTGEIIYKCWFQGTKQIIGEKCHDNPLAAISETSVMVRNYIKRLTEEFGVLEGDK